MEERTEIHGFGIEITDHHKRERKKIFIGDVPVGIDLDGFAEMLEKGFKHELDRWKKIREPKPRD